MSLDALFQQILLSEQHQNEQTERLKEVTLAIIRCKEKIQSFTERSGRAAEEREEKAEWLSAARLQRALTRKCEEQMLKHMEELLCQRSRLREQQAKIKKDSREREERFLREISKFNSDFSLRGARETLLESQTSSELQDLDREVESLSREMEVMISSNPHISGLEEETQGLLLERQDLDLILRDLDEQLTEAKAATESLRTESLSVSQRPLTDSTCLRLRKELEMQKEGELEAVREALGSEIHLLQSKLGSSQDGEQR